MNLLILTNRDESVEYFDEYFDNVEQEQIENVAPEVIDGAVDVRLNGRPVTDFDAAFLEITPRNAVFGRVLLEVLEEHNMNLNYPSTAFFTMAKKNYLYYVLHQKNVSAPKTAAISSEQAARNIEREMNAPLIARRFKNLKENDRKIVEKAGEIQDFARGLEHGDSFILFHQYLSGDKYRCLVTGDEVIALADETDGFEVGKNNLKYTNLPEDIRQTAKQAVNAIGAPIAEVLVIGHHVYDVNPNPPLEQYRDISGKNAYRRVADILRGEK